MHQTYPAVLNINNNRHGSFKLKFIMVFTHAFHWSLFSRISIQITPHSSMTCVSILSWNLLWYLHFLLIYMHSIWATHLIYFCTMGTGSYPGVKLTTHPLLVPRSRMTRSIPLLPIWAFGAWCELYLLTLFISPPEITGWRIHIWSSQLRGFLHLLTFCLL
jgi:hypothetical protein